MPDIRVDLPAAPRLTEYRWDAAGRKFSTMVVRSDNYIIEKVVARRKAAEFAAEMCIEIHEVINGLPLQSREAGETKKAAEAAKSGKIECSLSYIRQHSIPEMVTVECTPDGDYATVLNALVVTNYYKGLWGLQVCRFATYIEAVTTAAKVAMELSLPLLLVVEPEDLLEPEDS